VGKRNKLIDTVQVGNQYGSLTVVSLGREQRGKRIRPVAWCRCSCGFEKAVRIDHLAVGAITGCGKSAIVCREGSRDKRWKGAAVSNRREYASWQHMMDRCYSEKHPQFSHYGGRGIVVCERWASFESFLNDMGPRPEGMSLDRIDVNRGYEPENCRWATVKEQNRNKTNGTQVTFNGQTRSVTEWGEMLGISRLVIFGRLKLGWSVERALTTPVRVRRWGKKPVNILC